MPSHCRFEGDVPSNVYYWGLLSLVLGAYYWGLLSMVLGAYYWGLLSIVLVVYAYQQTCRYHQYFSS
jgi:hypothetical protein